MKNSAYTHNGSFRRSFFGLMKAIFMCAAYGALWVGIIFRTYSWGVPLSYAAELSCCSPFSFLP